MRLTNVPIGATCSSSQEAFWENRKEHRHRHQALEIAVILDGQGVFSVRDQAFAVQEGSVIFIAPQVEHAFTVFSGEMVFATIHSHGLPQTIDPLPHFFSTANAFALAHMPVSRLAAFDSLYQTCRSLLPQDPIACEDSPLWVSSLHLFTAFLGQNSIEASGRFHEKLPLAHPAISSLDPTRSIAEIADQVGLSEGHFRRIIKQHYGFSPKELLDKKRLTVAKTRLCEPLTISEVAEMTGFISLSAFSRWFHRQTGMAPSAWRENNT